MELDFITIEPVQLNWFMLCFPFYITVCIIVVALAWGVATQWDVPDTTRGVLIALFMISVVVGLICTNPVASNATEQTVLEHQVTALESQLGYTNIEIKQDDTNNTFVASTADGQYVSGKLVESDTDTYIVLLTQ